MFQQDQEIFNILLESVSDAVIIVDNCQHIMEVNDIAETTFGYPKTELINKPLNLLLPSNYHDNHALHFEKFIENGKRRRMGEASDIYGLKKSGDIIDIEVELNPFKIYDKTYVMALIRDVTELKETKKDLMLKSRALHSASNGIIITDALRADNPIIYFNSAFQNLTGYSSKEILNHNCRFLQGKDKHQPALKDLREAIQSGNNCQVTLRNYKKDGTMFWNDLYIMPITNQKGVVTHFIGIQNDVTGRKKVEERSELLQTALLKEKELNAMKTRFLSLVSHEFKTPLSGILTSATILSKYKLSEEQKKRDKHIKTISNKVHYLNNILNDFLSLEKLESGKLSFNFTDFKISEVIDEVVYNANMLLKEGQHIKYPKNINHVSLYQDKKILGLILANLVNNAIKYSNQNTVITIAIDQDNFETKIQIIDNGIGIPKKDQKNIFERYFRAENVINIQGTGIGLNIAKHYLENLGGNISFISEELKGSTFIITLPNTAS
ncbi:PAS domain S-box protein [Psychroserpens sp.]|uniref:sensor histidine kinase n=1 Tax=Psychroserpens sp. TaxID=2020870 RepID=UPI0038587BAE